WTSPSIDPATNTIYVSTGTEGKDPPSTQPQALAIVAIDASTMALKGSWQIPPAQTMRDSDFSTTPTLLMDAGKRQVVAAMNKNGYLYALDRSNVGAGPVWEREVALNIPGEPAGSFSSGAFDGKRYYVAGNYTTINGVGSSGFVRALYPSTGAYVWEH